MDFIEDFYEKDEEGKSGAERSGNRLNFGRFPDDAPLDVKAEFTGFEMCVHDNKESVHHGENYGLLRFLVLECLEDDEQAPVEGEEYSIYIEFSKKRKQSARDKEFEAFCEILSGLMGMSRDYLLLKGGEDVKGFISSGGEKYVGQHYNVYTVGKRKEWKKFMIQEA